MFASVNQSRKYLKPAMTIAAFVLFALTLPGARAPVCAACAGLGCEGPVREAYIVCCNVAIYDVGKEGIGTDRTKDCQDYVNNQATPETRRSICNQMAVMRYVCPVAAGVCKNYCGANTPQAGALFAQSSTGASGKIHSEPSAGSPLLVSAPNGSRLIYRKTTQINGQTWYYVTPPGKPAGWVPGSDVSCTRPGEPPPWTRLGPDLPSGDYGTPSYGGARG
jgi:hypothetical protein